MADLATGTPAPAPGAVLRDSPEGGLLADAWCAADPAAAGDLRGCADLAEAVGLGAALSALPLADDGAGRARVVRAWAA
jgi:hypothetical protein